MKENKFKSLDVIIVHPPTTWTVLFLSQLKAIDSKKLTSSSFSSPVLNLLTFHQISSYLNLKTLKGSSGSFCVDPKMD